MKPIFPAAVAAALAVTAFSTAAAGEMWLTIDHARFYESDRQIGSIVVANPAVADVTVKTNRELILFGKMPGATTLTLFDKDGEKIQTLSVRVRNPSSNVLTLHAGNTRYTFSCTTVCEQVAAIGDGNNQSRAELAGVQQQAARRNQAAASAAAGPARSMSSSVSSPSALMPAPEGVDAPPMADPET